MSSLSFNPTSPSTSQRPEALSTTPKPAFQDPNNSNAAAAETTFGSNLSDDPTERSTGQCAEVMNNQWTPAPRRSVLKANLESLYPDSLNYYEGRRTGRIKARSFEDWGESVSFHEEKRLYEIEHGKIDRVFFEVDYNHGFTGRGSELAPGAYTLLSLTYELIVLPKAMERPGELGPRNEKIEEIAAPKGGLSYEQRDRHLWQANDDKSGCPSEMSKDVEEFGPLGESRDDEDVGPLGETRDEEEVGPLGETRDGDDGLRQDYDEEEEEEEEEEEVSEAEVINNIMQSAAKTLGILSGLLADTGASTSTTSSTEPGASLTSSSHTLSSTPPTTSRKRTRESEKDAKDDDSPSQQKRRRMDNALEIERTSSSQQKRRRMDDVLGIIRKDTNAASNPQSIGAAMTPDVQQSRKRARSSDADCNEKTTRRGPKCLRLYLKPRDVANVGTGASTKDEPTLVYQPTSSNEVQKAVTVDKVTGVKVHTQASVEEVSFANRETNKGEDAAADDEAAPSQKEWSTAHGINSKGANIRVRGMGVFDLTGERVHFYLPTSRTSSPCRPLTEKEKEDLRVYIQDYGVQKWNVLAKSMNRTVRELRTEYLHYIMARNIAAGRHRMAGIPSAFPNLAPPRPPRDPDKTSKLRPRAKTGKAKTGWAKKNNLGDLTYDLKAKSFPRVTKDGGMVDARGNALLGIMGSIPVRQDLSRYGIRL